MKVIKPQRLALLQRVVEHRRKHTLVVTVMTYVPIEDTRKLLMEIQLFKDAGEVTPGGIVDEGLPKPCGEVLVSGSAFSVDGAPVTGIETRLSVWRDRQRLIDKKLVVIGNRYWIGNKPSEPVPFTSMPVDWHHSFGGEGFAQNPDGKGAQAVKTSDGDVVPLPNVEDRTAPIATREDRPLPAGYGPYPMAWPQRMEKVGKDYGDAWFEELYPGPAADFDARFYSAAPDDQQLDDFFAGSERIVIDGMHPSQRSIEACLTPLSVRAFATQRVGTTETPRERFIEVAMRADTVHVFPNRETLVVIYRGTLQVAEDDADDIVHLMVAADDPAHERPIVHYETVLARRLDKDHGALYAMKDEDLMPPVQEGWLARPDYGDLTDMTRLDLRMQKNAERGRKRGIAKARADLEAAGFDVEDAFVEPEIPEAPDPYDVDGMLAVMTQADTIARTLQAELDAKRTTMEADARAGFAEGGFDYDEAMLKAADTAGGPPAFSADEHIIMLHDLARIAAEGGQDMAELERDLVDPQYEQMLRDLEARVRASYITFAHLMPAAAIPSAAERQQLRVRVESAHSVGESMARQRLIGADLSGLDLRGIDLGDALLEGADLSGADLRGANLRGAVLARATLTKTSLADADLSLANLGACVLDGTDLTGAKLHDTVFMRSELNGVKLVGAELEGVDFIEVRFTAADFSHARLMAPLFLQADLRNVSFTGAQLQQARFMQVDLRGVDFTGAEMPQAQLIQARGDGASFAGATLTGAVLVHESSFREAIFDGANLSGANLRKTPLTKSRFTGANLDGADISGCDLRDATLYRITARQALMMRSDLGGADMRGADLLGAFLTKARLLGTNLASSNLSRSDLALVHTDGATKLDGSLSIDARVKPQRNSDEEPQVRA